MIGDDNMWIEKQANGKYKFVERYEDEFGKTHKVSVTMPNKSKESQAKAFEMLQKKMNTKPINKILFQDVANEWLDYYKQMVKVTTIKVYESYVERLNLSLGKVSIDKITAVTMNKLYLNYLQSEKLSYGIVQAIHSVFSRIMKFAYKFYGINKVDMLILIDIPKLNMSVRDDLKYLEPHELQKVLDFLDEQKRYEYKRMVLLLVQTGLRYGEMVSLRYEDVDLDNHTITVNRTYNAKGKIFLSPKTGNSRVIYINSETQKILSEQINYDRLKILRYGIDRDNKLLFKSKHGNPINIFDFNTLLKKVDIEGKVLSSHYFRHTFITIAVQNGMSKDLIARQVGHVDTKMIDQVYSHFTSQMQEQQKEAMQDFKIL